MGKGPAFACKICEMVPYILKYQRLPEHAKLKRIGAGSLLDNEAVVMGVHHYLAQVNLSQVHPHMNQIGQTETEFDALFQITPRLLAKHINEDLLPKLQPDSPPTKNKITKHAA